MTEKHISSHDHSDVPLLGRRDFLCHCCVGGAATAAILAGINRPALADQLNVKATHGTGLCNMAIFLAHARKMTEPYGINLELLIRRRPATRPRSSGLARSTCLRCPTRASSR